MENIQTSSLCLHPGCKCSRPATSDFCSEYCETAPQGGTDDDCQCGHPECGE